MKLASKYLLVRLRPGRLDDLAERPHRFVPFTLQAVCNCQRLPGYGQLVLRYSCQLVDDVLQGRHRLIECRGVSQRVVDEQADHWFNFLILAQDPSQVSLCGRHQSLKLRVDCVVGSAGNELTSPLDVLMYHLDVWRDVS